MYQHLTAGSSSVKTPDAVETGRILVVDDDRPFGTFLMAALQSRGHDVDWSGCIADAFATLYAQRYDLVIIDLRLPDGSGMEFLRDATDAGLLAESAAIILTGHELEQPDDIRVYRKTFEVDDFLNQMGGIIAIGKRRRPRADGRSPAAQRGQSHDVKRPPKRVKAELVLYISAASEKCQKAMRSIRQVLDRYDPDQVSLKICDLSGQPDAGDADAVIFTPTLVKRGPGPRTWIVGNLDHPDLLMDLLEVSGVSRRDGARV